MSATPATVELDALHHDAAPDAARDTAVRLSLFHRIMCNHRALPVLFPTVAILVLVSLNTQAPAWVVLLWAAAIAAIWLEIAVFSRRYFNGHLPRDPDTLDRALTIRYLNANIVWSAMLFLYWLPSNDPQDFFLVLLFVSHLAVATATTSYSRSVYLACTLPIALAISSAAIAAGTTIYLSVALLTLMVYAFMLGVSRQICAQSSAAVGLRLDHDNLIRDLAAAKAQSDAALAETEHANRQLAASERRFRALVDNAFDGVAIADAQGRITFATDAVARIFEAGPGALVGRSMQSLSVPEFRDGAEEEIRRVFSQPGAQGEVAGWGITATDRSIWVEATVRNMLDDPSVGGIVLNLRDATARKRADEELKMHLRVLESLATGAPMDEALQELARTMEQLHPGARASVLLRDETDCLHVGAAPSLPPLYRTALDGREAGPGAGPCGIAIARGKPVIVTDAASHEAFKDHGELVRELGVGAVWSQPMINRDGKVLGAVAMIYATPRQPQPEELSFLRGAAQLAAVAIDRRRAEQRLAEALRTAEVANHSKTQFLANMSHELRTPLNAIIGFSEIIREQMFGPVGAPEYVEYIGDIHSSGHHLLSLINDILDISKIEAGQMDLEETWLDPADAIRWSLDLVRERAKQGDVTLAATDIDALPRLQADERAIKQILLNLVSNAVKFTPAGGRVTVSAAANQGTGFVLRVADTGIGIEPHMIERVLEPFAQAEGPMARTYGGTGLGLPITKSLAELHGGSLALESTPGEGTLVTVTLPPARVGNAPPALPAEGA